jgi:hypothetical protein
VRPPPGLCHPTPSITSIGTEQEAVMRDDKWG